MGRSKGGVEISRGKIRITFQYQGRRHKESTGLPATKANLQHARRMVAEIAARIAAGVFDFAAYFPRSPRAAGAQAPDPTFRAVAERWLATLEITRSTRRSYESALVAFWYPALGDKPIRAIKASEIKAAIAGRFKSAKTRNNYLVTGRGVFAFALADEIIERDPAAGIVNAKVQAPEPDPLTLPELEAVLAKMAERYDPQVVAYFEFAFFTGLRPSEQIALTWADVDLQARTVKVHQARVAGETKAATKTYRVRLVELNSRALAALQRQAARTRLAGEAVFHNPATGRAWANESYQRRRYWQPTLRLLGMRARDAYQTRHTFATMNLMAGANPAWIARQMGHKNGQMLWARYGRWIPDADAGRERGKLEAVLVSGHTRATPTR